MTVGSGWWLFREGRACPLPRDGPSIARRPRHPDPILEKVVAAACEPDFEADFEEFAREHASAFFPTVDAGGDVEHRLEYTALHKKCARRTMPQMQVRMNMHAHKQLHVQIQMSQQGHLQRI